MKVGRIFILLSLWLASCGTRVNEHALEQRVPLQLNTCFASYQKDGNFNTVYGEYYFLDQFWYRTQAGYRKVKKDYSILSSNQIRVEGYPERLYFEFDNDSLYVISDNEIIRTYWKIECPEDQPEGELYRSEFEKNKFCLVCENMFYHRLLEYDQTGKW